MRLVTVTFALNKIARTDSHAGEEVKDFLHGQETGEWTNDSLLKALFSLYQDNSTL